MPDRAVELFVENPYWNVSNLAARLGVAFTTAQRTVDRLEKEGIAARVGDAKRNLVYHARAILDILDEPPKISASGAARRRRGRR